MRLRFSLLILLSIIIGSCSGSKSSLDENEVRSFAHPMELYIDSNSAMEQSSNKSVAKVYRGNNFVQSGAFISENGLFATNFLIAIEYFTTTTRNDVEWLENGYLADENNPELPLPNVSLMIEVEQRDISVQYNNQIQSNSTNNDIARVKQTVTQQIIQSEQSKYPNSIIQINELYNGDRYVLSRYQLISDVRLVYAPAAGITWSDLTDTKLLQSKIENLPVILRAYISESGNTVPFSSTSLSPAAQSVSEISNAKIVGFPDRSFRLDPYEALEFYNQSTNPNIILAYSAFIDKEARISAENPQYSIRTLANRMNIQQNLYFYQAVQNSFKNDSILVRKQQFDEELYSMIEADSTSKKKYGVISHYLNQAYEIANRQGASFYTTSYFLALSQLDEFAVIVKEYLDSNVIDPNSRLNPLLVDQRALLSRTNVNAELLQLADFITIFADLPKSQIPLSIQDILSKNPDLGPNNLDDFVISELGNSTALFSREKLINSITNNTLTEDPLYLLLDELIFAQETSRNNQSIFMAYAQPVQKVYNDAIRAHFNDINITADASGNLRINRGGVIPSSNSNLLDGFFNFTTKAFGSAVINDSGELVGILGDELPLNMSGNYLFPNNPQNYSVINFPFYLEQIRQAAPNSSLIYELDN